MLANKGIVTGVGVGVGGEFLFDIYIKKFFMSFYFYFCFNFYFCYNFYFLCLNNVKFIY